MKRFFALTFVCTAFFTAAKAQTISPQLLKTDTIKTLQNFSKYLKDHPVVSAKKGVVIDSPAFTYLKDLKKPLVTNDRLALNLTGVIAENMPVAKSNSIHRMPVLKLGDTQTTHFTMLIKPIAKK